MSEFQTADIISVVYWIAGKLSVRSFTINKFSLQYFVIAACIRIIKQTTTIWEENATYLTTENEFVYDNIGNILEQINKGDAAKSGDEKSTATTYAQAYEVGFNRPLETILKDKDANTISKKNFEYDLKGNLSKDTVFIFNPITQQTQETRRTRQTQ